MRFSFESPIALLEESLKYNDFEYALVHLFEKHPKYFDFYKKSIKNRDLYLDNSLYELGESYDTNKFKEYCDIFANINEDNFHYIVPDVWQNKKETIKNNENFKYNRGKRIGVVQASNASDAVECFKYMRDNCDIVAISFGASWYEDLFDNTAYGTEYRRMKGRQIFLDSLRPMLYKTTKIHLLGCYLPQEFGYYDESHQIYSADTSNPILHGAIGEVYKPIGMFNKSPIKMDSMIDKPLNELNWDSIQKNIELFKKMNDVL